MCVRVVLLGDHEHGCCWDPLATASTGPFGAAGLEGSPSPAGHIHYDWDLGVLVSQSPEVI